MIIVFFVQASVMFFFDQFTTTGGVLFGSRARGFQLRGLPVPVPGDGGVFGPNLAGMIADSTGSYARAYQVAGGLLLFAALLGIWSHMCLSFKLADKQLVITLGRRESSDKREPGEKEQDTLVA